VGEVGPYEQPPFGAKGVDVIYIMSDDAEVTLEGTVQIEMAASEVLDDGGESRRYLRI
jgi:hypothetical protein